MFALAHDMEGNSGTFQELEVKVAITIGSARLLPFVQLNIRRCRLVFGEDVPILVSDDKGQFTPEIQRMVEAEDCGFWTSESRMTHHSGDAQTFVNAIRFAEQVDADVALRISQRYIPLHPGFREALERTMADPNVMLCSPGRLFPQQIVRRQCMFYCKFPMLVDAVAIRRGALSADEYLNIYRERTAKGRQHNEALTEVTWLWICQNKFPGRFRAIPEWTNHVPGRPRLFLRKAQSHHQEFQRIAQADGVRGHFDIREWAEIDRDKYRCTAVEV